MWEDGHWGEFFQCVSPNIRREIDLDTFHCKYSNELNLQILMNQQDFGQRTLLFTSNDEGHGGGGAKEWQWEHIKWIEWHWTDELSVDVGVICWPDQSISLTFRTETINCDTCENKTMIESHLVQWRRIFNPQPSTLNPQSQMKWQRNSLKTPFGLGFRWESVRDNVEWINEYLLFTFNSINGHKTNNWVLGAAN